MSEDRPDMMLAAGWYAKHGIPVFPVHSPQGGICSCGKGDCDSPGKHPLTSHGYKDASTEHGQVAEWWREWPWANIGIPTGSRSRLLVLDCDPRNGGPANRGELIERYGPIPDTAEVNTGGGGSHFYFCHSGGSVPKTIGEGVDLKADGGYVVAPPSLHASGKRYEFDGMDGARAVLNPAPPPEWLLERIGLPRTTSVGRVLAADKWAPGERNDRLMSLAGTMKRRGMARESIEAGLLKENHRRCEPPLDDAEVHRIAESVSRYLANGAESRDGAFRIEDIPSVWQCEASTKWLVDNLIPESAVTLLCGDSGIGKSTLALALAGAVAHGGLFLGREIEKRPVLYVDRENPLAVVRERIERLAIAETAELRIWGLWVTPSPEGPTATNILQFASATRPLIIFDSLVGFHPGSEQDASETRRHMQAYIKLAAVGASVIVLHHTGKADTTKQYRGSSDIKAAVDVAYVLESLSGPDAGIRSLRLKAFKNRVTLPETVHVEYRDGRFDVSEQTTETHREIIERVIRQRPGASKNEIEKLAQAAGIAQKRTRTLLDEGTRAGWLVPDSGPRGRLSYRLAEIEIGLI
jgi:Bifunctional DNA primase/polymerase, N-terminal/AAA domain/Primase C terminal 1 (PriCT-1)